MSFKEVAACFTSFEPFWVFLPARCPRSFLKTESIDAEGQKEKISLTQSSYDPLCHSHRQNLLCRLRSSIGRLDPLLPEANCLMCRGLPHRHLASFERTKMHAGTSDLHSLVPKELWCM